MGFKKIIKTTILEYLNESELDIDKNSKIISSIDGIKIRIIDSEIVSKIFPVWENYLGSHHYGKKSDHIPENEIWISNKVPEKNLDKIIQHEIIERVIMRALQKYKGMDTEYSWDIAHNFVKNIGF
jgi:hypothetical protein